MEPMNRFLALLMCLVLASSSLLCALAEGDVPMEILFVEEITPVLESNFALAPDPDPTPYAQPSEATAAQAAEDLWEEAELLPVLEIEDVFACPPEAPAEDPAQDPLAEALYNVPSEPQPEAPAPPQILLEQREMILGVGESAVLTPGFSDGGNYALRFSSGDMNIAEVSPEGFVTAKAAGETEICIQSESGSEALVHLSVVPAPTAITLAAPKTAIGVGEAMQLTPVITAEGSSGAVKYTSSKKSIVAVDANGVVSGKKTGTATITATTYNGLKASLKITVKKAPTSIKLTADRAILGVGESLQLKYKLSKETAGSVSFNSSNADVATVSRAGEIAALAPGAAKITASTHNGKSASVNIEVREAPAAIELAACEVSIGEGDSWVLDYALNEGSVGTVHFASSDESIASVDAAGRIQAHLQGTAEITATAHNGVSAACSVSILPAPEGVSLAAAKKTIGVGETMQLDASILPEGLSGTLKYSSGSSKIVKVNQKGVVTGLQTGSAKITVSSCNGKKSSVSIKVVKAPYSLKITADRTTLGVGENLQLGYSLTKGSAAAVKYASSNSAVLHISESGYASALAAGTATITATTHNGLKKSLKFTVMDAPGSISFPQDEYTLGLGEKFAVPAFLTEGSAGAIHYESSNSAIMAVDAESGMVQGLSTGSATLHARAYNGLEASCTITVKNAPESLSLKESSISISVGDKYQLLDPAFGGDDAHSASLKFSSEDKNIASVNASGLISGKKAGTVKINVSTFNKKKDSVKLTVKAAPKSISFVEKDVYLFVDTLYTPQVSFSNKAKGNYTLSSSNPEVARIEGNSLYTLSGGTAIITATSFNGKTDEMKLTVPALPDHVALEPSVFTLGAGDSRVLMPVIPEGQGSRLSYESGDPGVAAVNGEGQVTAVAPGSTFIRVTAQNGVSSESIVNVIPAPTTVRLSPHSASRSLDEGELQLQTGFGSDAEGGRVFFTSSDETVATVSDDGLVAFHAVGNVKITATTYNGHSAFCSLTIGEKPGAMAFAQNEYQIALGDSISIPVTFDTGCESYSLSVGDASIAAAKDDTVRGLALGSTTLTATSRSGHFASCTLTVVEAPEGIRLSHSSAELTLRVGDALQLSAEVLPGGAGSVHYTSSDPGIATVDYHTGLVSPVGHGECTITAATYDGRHSAQCTIRTVHLLAGVKIGIDPGHQLNADRRMEAIAPNSSSKRHKVASGTRGVATKVREHVVNLQIGLKLRDALESFGAEVHMTRETADVNISNQQRAKMMNNLGVDLVLRVHCNASSRSSVHGMSIYVRKTGAKKAESKAAAKLILKYMSAQTGAKNLGVKYSNDYTGLNWSTVPSMLMELGYMTNRAEDKKLNNPEYQDKLVIGMINGICEYMGREIPYK